MGCSHVAHYPRQKALVFQFTACAAHRLLRTLGQSNLYSLKNYSQVQRTQVGISKCSRYFSPHRHQVACPTFCTAFHLPSHLAHPRQRLEREAPGASLGYRQWWQGCPLLWPAYVCPSRNGPSKMIPRRSVKKTGYRVEDLRRKPFDAHVRQGPTIFTSQVGRCTPVGGDSATHEALLRPRTTIVVIAGLGAHWNLPT